MKPLLTSKLFWAMVSLVILAIAAMAPNFPRNSRGGAQAACINNLRQLDGAVQQWALDHHKAATDAVTFADIKPYLRNVMDCPQDGFYSIGPTASNAPQCTIKGHHL